MRKLLSVAAFAAAAFMLCAAPAAAMVINGQELYPEIAAAVSDQSYEVAELTQAPVTIVQPDQVNSVADTLPSIIAAGIFALLLRIAGPFAFLLKVGRADQIIEKYAKGIIDDWLDHHPEWRTTGITVDVKKAWIADIASKVIAYAPGWLIGFLGGKEAIMQKVRNRIPDIIKDAFPAVFAAHYQPGSAPFVAPPAA